MERMNYTYKKIWLVNFPVMTSILTEQLINITDAVFLGHLGEVELGASALASVWYLAIYMLGFGFSLGLQSVIARYNGEKEYSETGRAFFQGLFALSAMAVALSLLSVWLSPAVLKKLIVSDEVYDAVCTYLEWRIWGLLFSFPFLALRSFLVGITQTGALTVAAVTAVSVNIPGNYLFIFVSDMGISGAAIASSLSELCSLIILVSYVSGRMKKDFYGLRFRFDKSLLKYILYVSVWSMLQAFISVAPWFLFFVAIEHLGKSELAVANIIRSISALFFVIVNSFATTAGALAGNLLGAGKEKEVFPLCGRIIRLAYGIGVPLVVSALVFHRQVVGVYTGDEALVALSWLPYAVMLLNYGFAVPGYVYMNAVIGTGGVKAAFLFQSITVLFYSVLLWGMSGRGVPLAVLWTVEWFFVIMLGIQSVVYLKVKHY